MKLYGVYKETYDEDDDEFQKIIVAVFRGEDKANKYKDYISVERGEWFGVEEIQTADDWIPGGYMVGTVSIKYTVTPNFAARISKIDESRVLFKKRIEPLCYTVNENPVYQIHVFDDQVRLEVNMDYNADESNNDDAEAILRNNCEGVLSRIVDKMNEGVYNLATLKECLK